MSHSPRVCRRDRGALSARSYGVSRTPAAPRSPLRLRCRDRGALSARSYAVSRTPVRFGPTRRSGSARRPHHRAVVEASGPQPSLLSTSVIPNSPHRWPCRPRREAARRCLQHRHHRWHVAWRG